MRTVNLLLVACVFAGIFLAMVVVSALCTSALHGQLQSRATPMVTTNFN